MDYLVHIPEYFYLGLGVVWHVVYNLPWPHLTDWFGSVAIFVGLYPIRIIMRAFVPEEKLARRVYRRPGRTPTAAEHQGASAIASEFLHH